MASLGLKARSRKSGCNGCCGGRVRWRCDTVSFLSPPAISHGDQRSCPLAVLLIPLSPHLPIINVVFTSAMKALYTARTLHRPYFEVKQMSPQEVEIWLEERKWGYRGEWLDAMVDHGADCRSLQALASRLPSSSRCQSSAWVSASRIESAPPCGLLIWRSASIDSLQAS